MSIKAFLCVAIILTALGAILIAIDNPGFSRIGLALIGAGIVAFELAHWPSLTP